QNLGVIASMRGDVPRALRHYRASLAGYRTLGLDHCVANLLNDIGLAYADLGRWDDAESTYRAALSLCELCGDASTALMVDVNRAAMRIARGDYVDAQVVCERVLQEARPLNDIRVLSEVYKHCGVIARELGRTEEAEEHLRVAYESALRREDLLLAAESAREQAELYTTLRRNRDALQALNASHRLFAKLRVQRDIADVRRRTRNQRTARLGRSRPAQGRRVPVGRPTDDPAPSRTLGWGRLPRRDDRRRNSRECSHFVRRRRVRCAHHPSPLSGRVLLRRSTRGDARRSWPRLRSRRARSIRTYSRVAARADRVPTPAPAPAPSVAGLTIGDGHYRIPIRRMMAPDLAAPKL